MLTEKFRKALEEYHRKKWFPEKYPDPFGEFVDYISEGMLADLLQTWNKKKQVAALDAGYYLYQILPQIRFGEIFEDYRTAISDPISKDIQAEFAFYYLRTLPEERSAELWTHLQNWNDKWETVLSEWCRAMLQFENDHLDFMNAFHERLRLDIQTEMSAMEKYLRDTRDLFAWQMQNQSQAKLFRDVLRHFRFQRWEQIADWNHFSALMKSVSESFGLSKLPKLQNSLNPATQFVFPVDPPHRVKLEHGFAQGLVDAMRFLQELGKGMFYSGMNPNLEIEERICGDPALPWFWGSILTSILIDSAAVKNFIGISAEGMERDTELVMEFWTRQEMFLCLYRNNTGTDWKNVQDNYASWWDAAFALEPPRFLYLYDLNRSSESVYRAIAMTRAKEVIQTLRSKYGSKWFATPKWTKRMRDYFWEGYRLTMQDVIRDL